MSASPLYPKSHGLIRLKFAVAALTACVLSSQTADIAQRLAGREIQSRRGGRGRDRTVHGPDAVSGGRRRGVRPVTVRVQPYLPRPRLGRSVAGSGRPGACAELFVSLNA